MPRIKHKKSKREQQLTKIAAAARKDIRRGRAKSSKLKGRFL